MKGKTLSCLLNVLLAGNSQQILTAGIEKIDNERHLTAIFNDLFLYRSGGAELHFKKLYQSAVEIEKN